MDTPHSRGCQEPEPIPWHAPPPNKDRARPIGHFADRVRLTRPLFDTAAASAPCHSALYVWPPERVLPCSPSPSELRKAGALFSSPPPRAGEMLSPCQGPGTCSEQLHSQLTTASKRRARVDTKCAEPIRKGAAT